MRLCENVNATNFSKSCLLKYITQPFLDTTNLHWHQNQWHAPLLAEVLSDFDYNVDVVNWDDDTVCLDQKMYDLVVDISPHNRQMYQDHLNPGSLQVLFATGSSPTWQLSQEQMRLDNLYRRRGIRLAPKTNPIYQYPSPNTFDGFFLFGSQHTLDTFGEIQTARTSFIANTGYLLPPPTDFSQKSPHCFLFLASRNQVLKGLDLLLEVFSANPCLTLYICSLFTQEPEFCQVYAKELFQLPNIKPIGFVDIYSSTFQALVQKCCYVIAPSASEGLSGSVLSAMSAGLVPIVSRDCGLDESGAHVLDDCSLESIQNAALYYSEQSPAWIRDESFRALATVRRRYSLANYLASIQKALTSLLGPPPTFSKPKTEKRSAFMTANIRVGIPLTGGKYWHGGISYIESVIKSISILPKNEHPELYLVLTPQSVVHLDSYQTLLPFFDDVVFVNPTAPEDTLEKALGKKPVWCQNYTELFALIDFYYPVNSDVLPFNQAISWIPDFQHKYFPDFFSDSEFQAREYQFQKVANEAKLVVFNSQDAENDFKKFYPESSAQTYVLEAGCLPEPDWYTANPADVQAKYNLPERFVLCSNQFWIHKNHLTLFRAAALLKESGQNIHIVCTGPTDDYRAPAYFTYLCNEIARLHLEDCITILGLIDRHDQIQLLRRCQLVVHPSLFEGLSLIVQECRALGKPLVLSDLDIHKQYRYGTLFNRLDAQDLAAKLAPLLASCNPGPDLTAEADAKQTALELTRNCGQKITSLLLSLAVPTPAPARPLPEITIITSLSPDNVSNEQLAIKSWRETGFKVVAVNTPYDIKQLSPSFPDIEFCPCARDAASRYGKTYVYFHELVSCCSNQPTSLVGIVKADIIFKPEIKDLVLREGTNSIIFGSCLHTDSINLKDGICHDGGFDYIFFDKNAINHYPNESFCLGLYWWDYWAILMSMAAGIPAKRLTSPVAWHMRHQTTPDVNLWKKLGIELSRYVEPEYAVTTDTLADYQQLLFQIIQDNSTVVTAEQ
ncbi:MAG: glycosyl transferase group 1 [Firmicutes bacterium]|nr:glycosyl transferase group 1 [Bacillota bacterium]